MTIFKYKKRGHLRLGCVKVSAPTLERFFVRHRKEKKRRMQRQMTGQLACSGCHVTLAYPLGAPSVRCPLCTTVTPVQQFQVMCVTCRCVLLLPMNTNLAMCPRCRTIMSIPPSISRGAGLQQTGPPKQCVYIDRPPAKTVSGKRSTRLCVGTKLDDDPV